MKDLPKQTAPKVSDMEATIGNILQRLNKLENSNAYTFQKNIQILDGKNIQLGGTVGTQIGVPTSKIGFFGVAPVAVPNVNTVSSGSSASDGVARTGVNAIIAALTSLGLIT